ncbi:MAG: GGDEF domain-containing protein [Gammaproteobacteria bacterium]|nr:MAG: GGDEF domain-containing protein [Gammaproteobacteria bacterium]
MQIHHIKKAESFAVPELKLITNKARNQEDVARISEAIQKLSLSVQRTLILEELLHILCEQIAQIVPCDGVEYQNERINVAWLSGVTAVHHASYEITLEEVSLGTLTAYRSHPFSDFDLQVMEWLVSVSVFPIRNALLYQEALAASLKDGLTGVGNRRAFDDTLKREFQKSRRNGRPMSLIVFDIDHFKKINDTIGHSGGDIVLKQVAQTLQKNLRISDQIFRYGGEEFVILLTDTDLPTARLVAERLRQSIEALPIAINDNNRIRVTISGGVTAIHDQDTPEAIFQRADNALYQAKTGGRNQIRSSV